MTAFRLSYRHDGFSQRGTDLFGGALQEAATAEAALRRLGCEEVSPGVYRDLREWQCSPIDGGAVLTHADFPGERVLADEG